MAAGRLPQPRALKILKGSEPRRINDDEPVPLVESSEPPPEMRPEVTEIWTFTLRHLTAMGTAAACDRDSLAAYCEAVAAHRRASSLLAQSDILIRGAKGGLIRNPLLVIQRDAAYTIRMFAQEFGLTPSARTRIEVQHRGVIDAHATEDNPFSGVG